MNHTATTVSIIIPIYYLPELYLTIQTCLDSVKKHYPNIELITIDDSIGDCPFKCTYKNESNLGYVKSINKGMSLSNADILIVLNDDLEILPNSLDKLTIIKGLTIASVQDSSGTSDDMFGSNFAITREAYNLIGGFDDRFKNYFADRRYYEKAINNGIKVVKFFDVTLPHHESATFNRVNKTELFAEDEETFRS